MSVSRSSARVTATCWPTPTWCCTSGRCCRPRSAGCDAGAVTIGFLTPSAELDGVRALRDAGVTAFSMELVPRISRAQSMDALTSQALVVGLPVRAGGGDAAAAVLPAVHDRGRHGAAGQGAGAGRRGGRAAGDRDRQAARCGRRGVRRAAGVGRRGAVDGCDVRRRWTSSRSRAPAATRARWARTGPARQRELLAPYVGQGRRPDHHRRGARAGRRRCWSPAAMVEAMKPGSVVVDLAAESGGNVEGSVAGRRSTWRSTGGAVTRARDGRRGLGDAGRREPALRQQRHQPAGC